MTVSCPSWKNLDANVNSGPISIPSTGVRLSVVTSGTLCAVTNTSSTGHSVGKIPNREKSIGKRYRTVGRKDAVRPSKKYRRSTYVIRIPPIQDITISSKSVRGRNAVARKKRGLLSTATKALPKPGYKMSIAHANAQALCPLFSCILWKVGRFSLPVNNSKTLLYVFVSRYHTTCYHKDRQYFQILAAVTAIISTGLMSNPGARFPVPGKAAIRQYADVPWRNVNCVDSDSG